MTIENSFNHLSRFSSHAIESISELHRFVSINHPKFIDDLPETISLMRQAHKFVLPFEGELVDLKTYRAEYAEMLRLPYPVISLEFATSGKTDGGVLRSSKIIILAWTDEHQTPFHIPDAIAGTIYFTNIWFDDEQNAWEPSPVVWSFHPDTLETDPTGEFLLSGFTPIPCHHNAFERLEQTGQALAFMENDLANQVRPIMEFCLTINCQNVEALAFPPPDKVLKKRMKNGREPLYTYHVLQLRAASEGSRHLGEPGAERTSPRQHWRRGHLRRLQSGKVAWVRPAIIGGNELGLVDKTYKLD